MKSMLYAAVALSVCAVAAASLETERFEPMIPYSFGYSTADGMSRTESGHNGVVTGSYSYTDANGDYRQVKYIADAHGYRPEGDISVDRKTAEAAAALAALAPKAPIPAYGGVLSAPSWVPAASAPIHAAPAPAYRPYNSFASQKAFSAPLLAAPAPAWSSHATPAGLASYQVDTPTHKIWVKY